MSRRGPKSQRTGQKKPKSRSQKKYTKPMKPEDIENINKILARMKTDLQRAINICEEFGGKVEGRKFNSGYHVR